MSVKSVKWTPYFLNIILSGSPTGILSKIIAGSIFKILLHHKLPVTLFDSEFLYFLRPQHQSSSW